MDPTPITDSDTLHPNNKVNEVPQITYSEATQKHIIFRRQRMIASRDTRDAPRDEYDGMGFLQFMDILKKADDQFVAPRKNKTDTSINMGTIRDKDTSLVTYATKYDFEPVAQTFNDQDEILEEMAETGEDLVRKSLMLEMWKEKSKLIYRSMVAFGTAVVEDQYVERWTIEKTLGKGSKVGALNAIWEDKKVKTYDGCQAKLWDLRKCYWGDIRKFFMNGPQGQPYFFTVEYESYDVVKQMFGDWERFKYVPTYGTITPEISNAQTYSSFWTLRPVTLNFCEIVRYYDPIMNEYAITLNGVDMLPIQEKKTTQNGIETTLVSGFPLTAISPSGAIPMAKYDLEPMHDFAISKSQPAKMRVLGDIENMFTKLMIGMFKQKAKPTMGNKSGKNYGPEATEPGTVINDIRDGDLFPVLPNYQGATTADFSMYELIKKELSKNSVEDSFQGINPSAADKTATQDMNEMKSMTLKIASLFDGIISGNNQLYWLRTYNIIENWTKPIDQQIDVFKKVIIDKYRTVTVPTTVDGGQKTTKKIIFKKDTPVVPDGKPTLNHSMDLHQQELDHQKNGNGDLRIVHLNPEELRSIKLNWYYSCVPVPNGVDPLSYMMFAKQIADATAFFGPESLNVKKLKHKFAALTGNDFDTWFISQQELEQKQQQAQAMQAEQDNADAPGNKSPIGPTIASAAKGAVPGNKMASVM